MNNEKISPFGIIIARYQTPHLHEGHKDLINFVKSRHDHLIFILGLAPFKYGYYNPLDFETRKLMILQEYPDAKVYYLNDTYSDTVWSDKLDELIYKITKVEDPCDVILYGSRDSFIPYYSGQFNTYSYKPKKIISATELRKHIEKGVSKKIKETYEYRIGVIDAVINTPVFAVPTVDILIYDENDDEILLGRRKDENLLSFIGAYVNPTETWFDVARRVCNTKLGFDIPKKGMKFFDSYYIPDWRWKKEKRKVTTSLIEIDLNYMNGNIYPLDNIEELVWVELNYKNKYLIVDYHRDMFVNVCENR